MRSLTFKFILVFVIILSAQSACIDAAYAQSNSCAGAEPTGNIVNPKEISVLLPEFTLLDPNNSPIIADFTLEIRNGAIVVQTFALTKTAFTLQTGTPASCYKTAFPAVTNPIQNNIAHQVALRANNMTGPGQFRVGSNSFFIQGVPTAPGSLRLAMLDMLSRLWDSVRLTKRFER